MRKEIKKQLQTIMDQAVKDNQIAGMNMMVIQASEFQYIDITAL